MARMRVGHATHPDWRMALALADAQLRARQGHGEPAATLGWCYFTDAYAPHAGELHDELKRRWPDVAWIGCVGFGVVADRAEYLDEPALALMLAALPREQLHVFHGGRPLPEGVAASALVHADPGLPDLSGLIDELGQRVQPRRLSGGLAWSRTGVVHLADGVWHGGLSGVGFGAGCGVISRVSQGCQPIGPVRALGAAMGNLALALDGQPAMSRLLDDLGLPDLRQPRQALPLIRATLVALAPAGQPLLDRAGQLDGAACVRPLVGVDPSREAVAVGERLQPGMQLVFVQRDAAAARRDLVRIASEIREELAEPLGPGSAAAAPPPAQGRALGAIYISCASRGGGFFGGPSAEIQLLQHALGDMPLVGFFAAGEIGCGTVHSHSAVLTVFSGHPPAP